MGLRGWQMGARPGRPRDGFQLVQVVSAPSQDSNISPPRRLSAVPNDCSILDEIPTRVQSATVLFCVFPFLQNPFPLFSGCALLLIFPGNSVSLLSKISLSLSYHKHCDIACDHSRSIDSFQIAREILIETNLPSTPPRFLAPCNHYNPNCVGNSLTGIFALFGQASGTNFGASDRHCVL